MANDTIAVFTAKSTERLLREGGSSSWNLNRGNARQMKYVVCTRNAHADWSEGDEEHGSAFVVGRISDIVPSPASEGRWLIQFNQFARISNANTWGGWRNPVRYTSLDALNLDIDDLEFENVSSTSTVIDDQPRPSAPEGNALTIDEAKRGLAATFGVDPGAIEITIRG